jgi:hypothetical protein
MAYIRSMETASWGVRKMQIKVLNREGRVIAEETAKSAAKRISVRLAAWQRQLDGMLTPGAWTASIGPSYFVIRNGRSLHVTTTVWEQAGLVNLLPEAAAAEKARREAANRNF